jgi:hypothetical protein
MAKKDDAADTAVEQTEKGELFGHLTDADKATVGFTDEELAEMDADEAEGEEAEGTEEAETTAEGEETEEAETPAEGEEAEGEDEEVAEEGEEAEEPAEAEKPTEEAAAAEEDVSDDDPAVQSLLDTRSVLPSEWSLGEGGVTKAQETLAGLDTKATELATKFDQGDITAADYRAQADQIETQRHSRARGEQFEQGHGHRGEAGRAGGYQAGGQGQGQPGAEGQAAGYSADAGAGAERRDQRRRRRQIRAARSPR